MAYKNDKLRDLTPLVTTFNPGESPSAPKLEGMIRQADNAIAYLENKLGDLAGEEAFFSTWVNTLARNVGDFSKLNPAVMPNIEVENYQQNLIEGNVEHELDMIPVGEIDDLIENSLDPCIVETQYKNTVEELEAPGDWTIEFFYSENNKKKRGRKLVTHSPSEGGSVVFKRVTSGRGSSLESSSENTIPSLAQAESDGPFVDIQLVDAFTKTYQVTLPQREKMYDRNGEVINFSASNTNSAVGLGSQYELPSFLFGLDGLGIELDDDGGFPKEIPLNLIKLYDWETKREIEGIISLKAAPSSTARRYQFQLQTKQDVILDTVNGKYIVVVPGNPIVDQLQGLIDTVYGNTGIGNDMTRLISHKNLMGLRTTSVNTADRSEYYGPSNIVNNDHSMYFHRNGFTDTDKGAGGNVIRGHVVVGNTVTGQDDNLHENFNLDQDSYSIYFGNINNGPELKYAKTETYTIDHSYGGLPVGIVDAGLMIKGATSDLDPSRKNIFLEGDIRTNGNIVLGKNASDVIFLQGKTYLNDELTFIPRVKAGLIEEEGKVFYSSEEKTLIWHNGNKWLSPWNFSGYSTVIGDGVTSFGKHNGTSIAPFVSALSEVSSGGSIKVLPGTYNFLGNKITVPANVKLEGSGDKTILKGTGLLLEVGGEGTFVDRIRIQDAATGYKTTHANSSLGNVTFENCSLAISFNGNAENFRILENVIFNNCGKNKEYTGTGILRSYETVTKNATAYSGSTVNDWSLKDEVLAEYNVPAGMSIVLDSAESAVGAESFKVTGNGNITCRKLLPVNISVGIAGHLNIKKLGTAGTASVGVICYDKDYVNLGTRNFIMTSESLGTGNLEDEFRKGMMIGTSGYAGLLFPVGTKFVRPVILITNNDGEVLFDSFEIFNLTYSRSSSWS